LHPNWDLKHVVEWVESATSSFNTDRQTALEVISLTTWDEWMVKRQIERVNELIAAVKKANETRSQPVEVDMSPRYWDHESGLLKDDDGEEEEAEEEEDEWSEELD
jgi:tRNA-dihydrouridine synthase